jgi:hypothetical protein
MVPAIAPPTVPSCLACDIPQPDSSNAIAQTAPTFPNHPLIIRFSFPFHWLSSEARQNCNAPSVRVNAAIALISGELPLKGRGNREHTTAKTLCDLAVLTIPSE